ncbi:MAG: hypothetical protein KAG97_10695, partial [Victivallales bacterium]|nr:hypothetical protein [Victivallales bacterium]
MIKKRISVAADEMEGAPTALFRGCETYGVVNGVNVSLPRRCVALDAGGEIGGVFNLAANDLEANESVFLINGMWDAYKDVPIDMINCSKTMDTSGFFRIEVNGKEVFNGRAVFWNYRRWRFWPTVEIRFPMEILRDGRNSFRILNLTKRFNNLDESAKIADDFLANVKYQVSGVRLVLSERKVPKNVAELPPDTFLGHIVGGHEIVHFDDEDYSHVIDLFTASRQGNLLVFMMNPGKSGFDIDLDLIDTDAIKRKDLKVALRYYGNNAPASIPEDEYAAKLKRFTERLGDAFVGFGPHEQHGTMNAILAENPSVVDVSFYRKAYLSCFAEKLSSIREIRGDVPIWDTDPSFYSHFHMAAGADLPAVELCVNNVSLDIASARGTAKAYGLNNWAAINSFECQAWGGLNMLDAKASEIADFELKRSSLWWLTQYLLYLGGARTIYSESGVFEHSVTLQKAFDDLHLVDLRTTQTEFVEFARVQRLQGQPLAEVAYLQGGYDIYKGDAFSNAAHSALGNSLYSWKSLEVCYPDVNRAIPQIENNLPAIVNAKLNTVSSTPYGQADIFPVDVASEIPKEYKILILTGWHTMTETLLEKLVAYVENGGSLSILLPHLTTTTLKSECYKKINREFARKLCGVELLDDSHTLQNIRCLRLAPSCDVADWEKSADCISRMKSAEFAVRSIALVATSARAIVET